VFSSRSSISFVLTSMEEQEVYHSDVVAATRQAIAESRHPRRWYMLFATTCSFAVVGLLSLLSAIVHKLCMPAEASNHGGMDMPADGRGKQQP